MCVIVGITRLSCSYCIWSSYCQNCRWIPPNFPLFGTIRFDTIEFNRLPCPNDKAYEDEVFADRFRYQLTFFANGVLVSISRLLRSHTAYVIAAAKITAEICWISIVWRHLKSIVSRALTTTCTMMSFSLVDSVINRLFWKTYIFMVILHMK